MIEGVDVGDGLMVAQLVFIICKWILSVLIAVMAKKQKTYVIVNELSHLMIYYIAVSIVEDFTNYKLGISFKKKSYQPKR